MHQTLNWMKCKLPHDENWGNRQKNVHSLCTHWRQVCPHVFLVAIQHCDFNHICSSCLWLRTVSRINWPPTATESQTIWRAAYLGWKSGTFKIELALEWCDAGWLPKDEISVQKKWHENKEGTTTNRAPAKHWSRKCPQTGELRLDGSMASRNLLGAESKNQRKNFSSKFFDLSAFLFAFVSNPYLCRNIQARFCLITAMGWAAFVYASLSDVSLHWTAWIVMCWVPTGKSCGAHVHTV